MVKLQELQQEEQKQVQMTEDESWLVILPCRHLPFDVLFKNEKSDSLPFTSRCILRSTYLSLCYQGVMYKQVPLLGLAAVLEE